MRRVIPFVGVAAGVALLVTGIAGSASAGSLPPPAPSPLVTVQLNVHNGQTTSSNPKLVGTCTAKATGAKIVDMRLFVDGGFYAYSVGGQKTSTFWHVPGKYNQFSVNRVVSNPLTDGRHTLAVQCWDNTPKRNLSVVSATWTVHRRPGDPKPPEVDRIITTPENLAVVCRQPIVTVRVVGPSAPRVTHIKLAVLNAAGVKVFSGEGHTSSLSVRAPKPLAPGKYKITATVQDTYDVHSFFLVR